MSASAGATRHRGEKIESPRPDNDYPIADVGPGSVCPGRLPRPAIVHPGRGAVHVVHCNMPPVWPPPRPRAQQGEVLALQRKLALQLDGIQQAMNTRFNIFHEELALMRASEPERIIIPPLPPRRWSIPQLAALGAALLLASAVGSLLTVLVEPYGAWLRGVAWP